MAKSNPDFVCCLECRNGIFMQWFSNPIVAYCRELRERVVAQAPRNCSFFMPSGIENPEIRHFDSYQKRQVEDYLSEKYSIK